MKQNRHRRLQELNLLQFNPNRHRYQESKNADSVVGATKVAWNNNPVRFVVRVKPAGAAQGNQQRQLPLSIIRPKQTGQPTTAKLENYEVRCDEVLGSSTSHGTVFKQA